MIPGKAVQVLPGTFGHRDKSFESAARRVPRFSENFGDFTNFVWPPPYEHLYGAPA
jgi:hypothetical protein